MSKKIKSFFAATGAILALSSISMPAFADSFTNKKCYDTGEVGLTSAYSGTYHGAESTISSYSANKTGTTLYVRAYIGVTQKGQISYTQANSSPRTIYSCTGTNGVWQVCAQVKRQGNSDTIVTVTGTAYMS